MNTAAVVVIGAGPTGVTAATLLAKSGIATTVLDRWPDVYPQPRAVHLDDEVFRILDRLGIADQFAAVSRPALGLRLIDPKMRVLAEFQRDPGQQRHGHPSANMFDQPQLEALLRRNLAHHPQATLLGDVDVTGISDVGDGRSRVTYVDRSSGAEALIDADYVLGCDGANSLVRESIGSRMQDLKFEQRWLVIDVVSTAELEQWDGVHQLCDSRRAGTFMRIGSDRYRWEFRLLDGEKAADFGDLQALRPLIAPWTGHVDESSLEIIRVAEYTFRAKIADRWRRGNTFLLGDAAHLTPPFVGQGLCAGLRDSMNLSWKLAAVINGTLDAHVLDTYEQERKPHARAMIDLALTVGRAMTSGGRLGDLLRGIMVPRIHLLPGLREKIMDSQTPRLTKSALVTGPGALAGSLCPNAVTSDGRRVDDLLGDGFAVISTRALTDPEKARADKAGAAVHIAEAGTPLADWLHRGRAQAVLVRPDRTVMCVGRDSGEVIDALSARVGN